MAMSIGPADGDDEDAPLSTINTTPLVDVMLVLLIIFLITIPVVTQTVPVRLPDERQQPTQAKPDDIVIAVDRDGAVWWGLQRLPDAAALLQRLQAAARQAPAPQVQLRGDADTPYEHIARVVAACRQAGIAKVGFITLPSAP
ncbi:ExbD/TolR family protein [Aquabacterium sp. J223]|uniref:ExbD/TolR family protein n=1 Tax=Aquabacterium sp. J223 TaxID=2898431 RepID=UPI0021ADDBB6|nr:biopolymer transporter ExbD [Aquabacterium sp. J223]UUX94580.1 biopolymer transporter ExbD [Aquabacterium sp. J223]